MILITFLIAGRIFGQATSFQIQRITQNDGLSHSSGICILQDSDGFLWIGTSNGLSRYDGVSFKNFLHVSGDSTSLAHNLINSLFEDSNGTLWVGTNQGGLCKYNKLSENFQSYSHRDSDSGSIGAGSVYGIGEDVHGNLWAAVNPSGLYFFDRESEKFRKFNLPNSEKSSRTFAVYAGKDSSLWIGTISGVYRITFPKAAPSPQNYNSFQFLRQNCEVEFWGHQNAGPGREILFPETLAFAEFFHSQKSAIFSAQWGGISKFVKQGSDWKLKTLPSPFRQAEQNKYWKVYIDSRNRFWSGAYNRGISVFELDENILPQKRIHFDQISESLFGNWTIRSIVEDNSGIIWAGSESHGILKISTNRINARFYSDKRAEAESIYGSEIRALLVDSRGQIWAGTKYNGLNKIQLRRDGSIKSLRHYIPSGSKASIPHFYVHGILEDSRKNVWIACWTTSGGLAKYNSETDDFAVYQNEPGEDNSLAENQTLVLEEDMNGDIMIGMSERGLDRFDPKAKTFQHYFNIPDDSNSLSLSNVSDILLDSQNRLWIATYGRGLNLYRRETDDFRRLPFGNAPRSLGDGTIVSLYEDKEGRLWIASLGGITVFDPETEEIEIINSGSGLSSNLARGVVEDDDGDFWISTDRGITKIEKDSRKATSYGRNDGLPEVDFTSRTLRKLPSGELISGTRSGLVVFAHDDSKNESVNLPRTVITSFKVFNKDFPLDTAITFKKQIRLNYDQNYFTLQFAVLDFSAPELNQFRYRIGTDKAEWIEAGNRNYVEFVNMAPGDYTFEVLGANRDNVWSRSPATLTLIITPPFWRTAWFQILLFFGFAGLGFLFIKGMLSRKYEEQLRRFEIEQKIQEERERISSDLHDNIGSNLTGIVTGLEITNKYLERNDRKKAGSNIETIEKHAKETIDLLRQAIWSLQSDVKTCGALVEKVREFVHQQVKLGSKPLPEIHSRVDENLKLTPFVSLNLYRIIQEAISNSVKYSGAEFVRISFSQPAEENIKITIADKGAGFDCSRVKDSGRGFGLSNMRRRAEKISAELSIVSKPGEGTQVSIKVTI